MAIPWTTPGVFFREFDESEYTPQQGATPVALIGTAPWGPINEPQLITSLTQFFGIFGPPTGVLEQGVPPGPPIPEHPMHYAAQRAFRRGRRVWAVRVESSTDPGSKSDNVSDLLDISSNVAATVTALYNGTVGNMIRIQVRDGTQTGTKRIQVYLKSPYSNLVEIVEDFNNVVMDPTNVDPNSIENRIGNGVDTVQVSEWITITDLSVGDPLEDVNEDSPLGSGAIYVALSGGDDGWVPVGGDEDFVGTISVTGDRTGLQTLCDVERYDVSIVAIPGRSSRIIANGLIDFAQLKRGDCIALIDPPYGLNVEDVAKWHNGDLPGTASFGTDLNPTSPLNSSFAAMYWPWVSADDVYNNAEVALPPSAFAIEAMLFTDFNADPWFAPAGFQRAIIRGVTSAERTMTEADIERIYGNGNAVNPIRTFIGTGPVIWGQRTTQREATALDRINVRRLLNYLKPIIRTATLPFVFQPNDSTLWRRVTSTLNGVLEPVKQRRGVNQYRVIMDGTTNPPEIVEQNIAVAKIFIQPIKTAETIVVDFIITPQGAQFEEVVSTSV